MLIVSGYGYIAGLPATAVAIFNFAGIGVGSTLVGMRRWLAPHASKPVVKPKPIIEEDMDTKEAKFKDHLRCPISQCFMEDPVLLIESGIIYDRLALLEWFATCERRKVPHNIPTEPTTNLVLKSKEFVPVFTMKSITQSWIDHFPDKNNETEEDEEFTYSSNNKIS